MIDLFHKLSHWLSLNSSYTDLSIVDGNLFLCERCNDCNEYKIRMNFGSIEKYNNFLNKKNDEDCFG